MVMILVLALILSVYGAINYYIGLRCWQAIGSHLFFLNNKMYWLIFTLIVASYFLGRLLKKFLPDFVSHGLTLIGAYWMAAMVYFLIAVVIIDFIRVLNAWLGFLPEVSKNNSFSLYLGITVLLSGILLMIVGTWWAQNLQVTKYELNIDKHAGTLKELRVVMISDSHLGNIVDRSQLERIVDKINQRNPDIVLIPGDIIDDDIEPFIKQGMAEEFKRIQSKYGVYASFGNHEYYGTPPEEIAKRLKEAGVIVLRDESVKVDNSFYIGGREDKAFERNKQNKRKSVDELMEGMDVSLPIILMDHTPDHNGEAQKAGVDLLLSGHTHKGQIFPGDLITKKLFKVDYGVLKKGNLNVIVSSGVGTWGPPIRVGTSSEIVDIMIRFQ